MQGDIIIKWLYGYCATKQQRQQDQQQHCYEQILFNNHLKFFCLGASECVCALFMTVPNLWRRKNLYDVEQYTTLEIAAGWKVIDDEQRTNYLQLNLPITKRAAIKL